MGGAERLDEQRPNNRIGENNVHRSLHLLFGEFDGIGHSAFDGATDILPDLVDHGLVVEQLFSNGLRAGLVEDGSLREETPPGERSNQKGGAKNQASNDATKHGGHVRTPKE